jgi:4-amino-4-deoxy-L-arabinose transferase-like glycosyltransferase
LQLAVHLLTAVRFGIFRDELYYLACADRLAWGYVDHPPLSIAILAGARGLLGDGLWAVRLPVALASAAVVVFGASLTRELGGRRFAQGLTALCLTIAPIVLILGGFHSMNAFEQIFWLLGALFLTRALRVGSTREWTALGLVVGLGLLNKLSMGVFAVAMTGGLGLTAHRRVLSRRGFWFTVAIATLVFLPHLMWQATHGWPTPEFAANAMRNKITAMSPLDFLMENALEVHPASLIVWIPGLIWLLIGGGRRHRVLAWVFLLSALVMLLQRTKPYYLTPTVLPLHAAHVGSCAVAGCHRALPRGDTLAAQHGGGCCTRSGPAAVLRRSFRLARAGGGRGDGLHRIAGRRARTVRHPLRQLRPGGRHRVLRTRPRPARTLLRAQQLLSLVVGGRGR